jgi:hypothetical protein
MRDCLKELLLMLQTDEQIKEKFGVVRCVDWGHRQGDDNDTWSTSMCKKLTDMAVQVKLDISKVKSDNVRRLPWMPNAVSCI